MGAMTEAKLQERIALARAAYQRGEMDGFAFAVSVNGGPECFGLLRETRELQATRFEDDAPRPAIGLRSWKVEVHGETGLQWDEFASVRVRLGDVGLPILAGDAILAEAELDDDGHLTTTLLGNGKLTLDLPTHGDGK